MKKIFFLFFVVMTSFTIGACAKKSDGGSKSNPPKKTEDIFSRAQDELTGTPHNFHGIKTGACTYTSPVAPREEIKAGFFTAEITQTQTTIKISLICSPEQGVPQGTRYSVLPELTISQNALSGENVSEGKIGSKGFTLKTTNIHGVDYSFRSIVADKIYFQVIESFEGETWSTMTGTLQE